MTILTDIQQTKRVCIDGEKKSTMVKFNLPHRDRSHFTITFSFKGIDSGISKYGI